MQVTMLAQLHWHGSTLCPIHLFHLRLVERFASLLSLQQFLGISHCGDAGLRQDFKCYEVGKHVFVKLLEGY